MALSLWVVPRLMGRDYDAAGAFFIDFTNALIITAFLNIWR